MKQLPLKDKVAVVTGGARGIGRAICARYVQEGATVAVADLDLNEARSTAETLGRSAFGVQLDVTRQDSIEDMVERIVTVASAIDILVNNAGFLTCVRSSRSRRKATKRYLPLTSRVSFLLSRRWPDRWSSKDAVENSSTCLPRRAAAERR